MKDITALKLTCVGAFVATLGVGCASSGYARYDADQTDMNQGVGVSASANVGTDTSASVRTDANTGTDSATVIRAKDIDENSVLTSVDTKPVQGEPVVVTTTHNNNLASTHHLAGTQDNVNVGTVADTEGEERVTVSALSFSPDTRPARFSNQFPFYDRNWRLRTVDVYTFAVPDDVDLNNDNDREFSASMPAGSVFVEAAGGAGEVRSGRIIQHSPSPTR